MVLNNDSHTTEHTQHIKERSCRKETVARSAGAAAFASTAQHKKNMFLLGGFTNCGGQYRCNDDVRVCRVRIRTRLSRQAKGKVLGYRSARGELLGEGDCGYRCFGTAPYIYI